MRSWSSPQGSTILVLRELRITAQRLGRGLIALHILSLVYRHFAHTRGEDTSIEVSERHIAL